MVGLVLGLVLFLLHHPPCFITLANSISCFPSILILTYKAVIPWQWNGVFWFQEVNYFLWTSTFSPRGAYFTYPTSQHCGGFTEMSSSRNSLGDKEGIVLKGHDCSLEIQRENKLRSLLTLVRFSLEMNSQFLGFFWNMQLISKIKAFQKGLLCRTSRPLMSF